MGGCCSTPEETVNPRSDTVAVEVRPQQHKEHQQHQEPTAQPDSPSKSVLGHWEDIRSHYIFDKVLGRGQFGVTRLVVHRVTGERAACKSISKRKLVNPEDVEDVRREVKVMHHLR